jgi:DNA-binding MarR family transcriptional regulator
MNNHVTHHTRQKIAQPLLATPQISSDSAQLAAEAIYKVAEVARTLKYATHIVERMVNPLSRANEHLTLFHWLILIRLSNAPTYKQMDLKSDTKIAAAYLSKLLDDLTREGMVRRHRSSSDRRQILLALTDHGRGTVLELLALRNDVTRPSQVDALEHLGVSLERFVSSALSRDVSEIRRSP